VPLELKIMFLATVVILGLLTYFGIFIYPYRELSEQTRIRTRSFISNAFFREFWYFLMGPLKVKLIKWGVHPNTITWWGFIFSLGAGMYFALGKFGIAGWLTIFAATCDVYDGQLARARAISLKSGSFLDSVLDRLGEAAMFFGLAWWFRNDPLWFGTIFLGFTASNLVSYARSRAEGLGYTGAVGFFQRAERMIVLSVGMTLYPVFDYFTSYSHELLTFTLAFLCWGSVQTAVSRGVSIYRSMLRDEAKG
jgi:CDP-diacylglycerol---glycerol-3-phosphate 3-phosphatidyltransferase